VQDALGASSDHTPSPMTAPLFLDPTSADGACTTQDIDNQVSLRERQLSACTLHKEAPIAQRKGTQVTWVDIGATLCVLLHSTWSDVPCVQVTIVLFASIPNVRCKRGILLHTAGLRRPANAPYRHHIQRRSFGGGYCPGSDDPLDLVARSRS